ncbi:MAG: NUDIX hydrolase [Bacteroidota bacterium]
MNFCSNCGSDQLRFEIPAGDSRHRYVCHNCHTIHYQNPKMVVGCLPIWEDKILICKRAIQPRAGFWNLPAGYLENGETLEQGATRETWEEAQARVELIRLHCVYNIPRINQVYFFFLAKLVKPEFGIGEESLAVELFEADRIPYEEMAFPSSVYAIRKFLANKDTGFEGVHIGAFKH